MPTLSRATTHTHGDFLANQGTGLGQESGEWISAPTSPWYTVVYWTLPLPLLVLKTPLKKDLERCCSTWTDLSNPSYCFITFLMLAASDIPVQPWDPTLTFTLLMKLLTGLKLAIGQYPHLATIFPHFLSPLPILLSLNPLSLLPMLRKTLNLLDNQLVCSMLRPHHA